MSAVVVLAIVIATQDVDDQATEAMRATAAEALGSEDAVVVREVEVPSDAEALRIERSVSSQTAAEVVWLDATRIRARVRVHVGDTGRWTERIIAFSSVDTPVERGRALGFAITSMLPEEALAANPHRGERPPPASPALGELRTALRLAAVGSNGYGGGIGGSLAGEFFFTQSLLMRLGFAGRQVTLEGLKAKSTSADASDVVGAATVGVGYWPLRAGPQRRLAVGLRVDLLAIYHGVSREAFDGGTQQLSVWLPGMDTVAEIGFNIFGSLEITASVGAEIAFSEPFFQIEQRNPAGTTVAVIRGGQIPPIRGVAEVGIRISF